MLGTSWVDNIRDKYKIYCPLNNSVILKNLIAKKVNLLNTKILEKYLTEINPDYIIHALRIYKC